MAPENYPCPHRTLVETRKASWCMSDLRRIECRDCWTCLYDADLHDAITDVVGKATTPAKARMMRCEPT